MLDNLADIQVKNVMTTKILAAQAKDSVLDVARILVARSFDGMPIVNENNELIGMITTHELLDNNGFYLPTVVKILRELRVSHGQDVKDVENEIQMVKNLRVESVMNKEPAYLLDNTTLREAAETFLLKRQDPLPVVNSEKKLVGIISKYDALKALTNPLQPLGVKAGLTEETEPFNLVEKLGENFVVVSKTRLRFWYLALAVFLALGIVIAITLILRIRII